jgi:hypothetical protein
VLTQTLCSCSVLLIETPRQKIGVDMKVYGEYRFRNATLNVKVVAIYRKGFRRYVDFYTMYNGTMVGKKRTVLYSYAKTNWVPA